MRQLIGHAGKYILLLLMLVCFGYILSSGTQISGYGTPIIYYLDESPYTLDTVIDMKENDETLDNYLPFTATGTLNNQAFSNPDLGRELNCQMTYIYGSSSLFCSASGEMMADDLSGCILSSEAAWQLFGETAVIGGDVLYKEQNYYVRGVYESDTAAVILPAETVFTKKDSTSDPSSDADTEGSYTDMTPVLGGDTSEAAFDKIIVKPASDTESSNTRSEYVQAFENRWGLSGSKTDCLIYQRLAAFFMMLIPAMIFICVMWKGLRYVIASRYKPFWFVAGLAGLAIMFVAFFVICQTTPSIPSDLIPNRWSDFDFWRDTIETFSSSIQHILFLNKSEIELSYFKPLTGMIGYTLLGVILFAAANVTFRITDTQTFFIAVTGTCVAELIAVFLMRRSDLMLNAQQMLLYLWPYLLLGKFIFKRQKSD